MVFVVMDVSDRVTTEVAAVGEGGDELLFLLGGEVAGGHDGFEAVTEIGDGFVVGWERSRSVFCGRGLWGVSGVGGGVFVFVEGIGYMVGPVELVCLEDEAGKVGGGPVGGDVVLFEKVILDGAEDVGGETFDKDKAKVVTLHLVFVCGLGKLGDEL